MKKTITFAVMHFSVAFMVAYLLTGSIVVGGAVALVEPAINTVAFYVHERVWKRIEAAKGKLDTCCMLLWACECARADIGQML